MIRQSDFHMVGRDGAPGGWHSKPDVREKVVDIRDPRASMHKAYPHTLKKDREFAKLCFCCKRGKLKLI